MTELALTFPPDVVEAIAQRAAEIALEKLEQRTTPPDVSPHLTVKEAALVLGCGEQRVRNLLTERKLTRIKDGGRTLIERAELERYLAGEPTGPLGAIAHSLPRPYRDGYARAIRR